MAFITKKVQTQTLGEYLIACRKALGFSISEVAQLSQVQPKYIQALEEGNFQVLPAGVYVKGFLKNLAKVYRIKEEGVLEQFLHEQQVQNNLENFGEIGNPKKFVLPRFILSPRTLAIGSAALLGLLSLAYLYFQISSLKRPPALEVFSPEKDEIANTSLLLVRGRSEPGASVYLNNQALVTDAEGEFRENLSLAPGSNQLVIKAVNKFGQETTVTRSIILEEKAIAGVSTGTMGQPEILTLEIKVGPSSAWIALEADGIEKYSGTMLSNSAKVVTAQNKITLTTGNAGATRIILNDKDLGILGKEGEVIRDIEFTP